MSKYMSTMTAAGLRLILITAASTVASVTGSCPCDDQPLTTFDLGSLIRCGYNSAAWTIWIEPDIAPYCLLDSVDNTQDGGYLCFKFENNTCRRIPYLYYQRSGVGNPNYLARDGKGCAMSKSLILDTDNCKFLIQSECYADGSVTRYVTYKESWSQQDRQIYLQSIQNIPALSFMRNLKINCENGIP